MNKNIGQAVLSIALTFAGVNAHALYVSCPSAQLTIGIKPNDTKNAKVQYKGLAYKAKVKTANYKSTINFKDHDTKKKVSISFSSEIMYFRSGITQVTVNGKKNNCNFSNGSPIDI